MSTSLSECFFFADHVCERTIGSGGTVGCAGSTEPLLFANALTAHFSSLRKHSYSNILKILRPKKENFQIKNSNIFHISAQNIDCGYSSTHNLCFEQKYEK